MYNKRTSYVQQKVSYWRFSFETFFIVSIDLQWSKFLKNTWDGLKVSHLYKVTFSVINFIKEVYLCKYSWRNISMYFGRVSFENTSQLYETFDNINFQTIVIASNLTEPDDYWTKVGEFLQRWFNIGTFLVKHLQEIAIALVRLKKPSCEKFYKLWQIHRSAWKC